EPDPAGELPRLRPQTTRAARAAPMQVHRCRGRSAVRTLRAEAVQGAKIAAQPFLDRLAGLLRRAEVGEVDFLGDAGADRLAFEHVPGLDREVGRIQRVGLAVEG